jgi:PST family polysaccharide transporter
LGVYQVSGQIALLPTAQIGAQMRAVLFPAFSKIEDVPRLRRAFLDAFGVFFLLALPAASFLAVFAQLVVGIMLGPKWADASPFLRVLVWAGVMKGFAALAAALSLAVGRPRIAVTASLVNIGLFAVLAYPLMSGLGLRGAALLIVLSSAATVVYYVSAVRPMLQLKLRDLVRCCRPAILAALPCVAAAPLVGSTVDGKTFAVAFCAAVSSALLILAALRRHFPARSPAIREAGAGADA